MATYNGEKYIYQQIKSILNQLSALDELIISDDGSKDQTILILESFNDTRIKIFKNEKSNGPVGNFENALSKAKGDIIFLADQDDVWLPGKINTHTLLHEKYDLVISDAKVVNEAGDMIYESFFKERDSRPGLFNNLIKNSYIGCCMSFNRRILNYALPFPAYIHMHDWWIGLIGELKGHTIFCNDQLMNYVRHQNNASPTLSRSGYSGLKRLKNRVQLIYGLFFIVFK
ncbi:glycosyltransferase family 2 protein [Mucilaginibacter frigoritolerans]